MGDVVLRLARTGEVRVGPEEGGVPRYHDILNPADLQDPALGLPPLLRKLR